jgi:hypothetical protein
MKFLVRLLKRLKKARNDMGNIYHPKHYNESGRKECWDEMVEIFGAEAVVIFDCLNAYKYFYRAGKKSGNPESQDNAKMINYCEHAKMLVQKNSDMAESRKVLEKLEKFVYFSKDSEIQIS